MPFCSTELPQPVGPDRSVQGSAWIHRGKVATNGVNTHHAIVGSRIVITEAALAPPTESAVLFPVSQVQCPHFDGNLHELRTMAPGKPL